MPRTSISPRAAAPRRARGGSPRPTGRSSCRSVRWPRRAGWRRAPAIRAAVGRRIEASGSLIAMIEALRGPGRSLRPYEIPNLRAVETWLADNEVLDPEGPQEMFESFTRRGLLRRLRWTFSNQTWT